MQGAAEIAACWFVHDNVGNLRLKPGDTKTLLSTHAGAQQHKSLAVPLGAAALFGGHFADQATYDVVNAWSR